MIGELVQQSTIHHRQGELGRDWMSELVVHRDVDLDLRAGPDRGVRRGEGHFQVALQRQVELRLVEGGTLHTGRRQGGVRELVAVDLPFERVIPFMDRL